MVDLPRSADILDDAARTALERLATTYPTYRIHKMEDSRSFPMSVRVMTVALQRYRDELGTPIALAQTLFPGKHIDLIMAYLDTEIYTSSEMCRGVTSFKQTTWKNDWRLLSTLKGFLMPLQKKGRPNWPSPIG